MGKAKYAWLTAFPAIFVGVTPVAAGILSVRDMFWPMTKVAATAVQGYMDAYFDGDLYHRCIFSCR